VVSQQKQQLRAYRVKHTQVPDARAALPLVVISKALLADDMGPVHGIMGTGVMDILGLLGIGPQRWQMRVCVL
jgi:hypothetical protein